MIQIGKLFPQELCYTAPFTFILSTYGLSYSNETVFGLGQGLAFEFFYIRQFRRSKEREDSDWVSISGSKNIVENLKSVFGIEFIKACQDSRKSEAIQLLKKECQIGYMPIVYLDTYYLKYHANYGKHHGQTNVVITGFGKEIEIIDFHVSSYPLTLYQGTISLSELNKSLIIGENEFIEEKGSVILNRKVDILKSIDSMESIKKNCQDFLFAPTAFQGVEGIYMFAEEFLLWSSWDEKKIRLVMQQLYLHITGRGGPAVTRKAYHRFLLEHFSSSSQIYNLAEQLALSAKEWQLLAGIFFKNFYKGKTDFEKCHTLIINIAELEKTVFTSLLEVSQNETSYKYSK